MSDERQFKIKITTTADPSGAVTTTEELTKLGRAQDEAGKKAETHGGHLRGMHKIIHALNEAVPGLGVLMQAAFSPVGATISVALMMLRLFQEKLKEVNAEFEKMEEEAARPATNRMTAWREATVQAATGMDHLHQALSDTARGQETLKETTAKADAAFREQMQAANSLADALKDNEIARLDEMHAAGLVSEQQYAQQRLQIEFGFEGKKRELQEQEAMREILIRRRALEQAEMAQPGLTSAAEAAIGRKVVALEDLGSLDKSGIEDRKKTTEAALKAFQAKYPQWSEWFEGFGTGAKPADVSAKLGTRENLSAFQASGGFRGMFGGAGLSEAYAEWAGLKTAAGGANAEWKQFPHAEAERKVAADRASAEAERAEKAAIANQGFITETGRDLGERRGRFGAMHSANAEMGSLESDTLVRRSAAASPQINLLREAIAAEQILHHGGQISMGQQVQIKAASELSNRAIAELGHAMVSSQTSMQKQILQLAKQLRGLTSQP